MTKNDWYFNRYGCSLYMNKARLPVSQIFFTVTKYFFSSSMHLGLVNTSSVDGEQTVQALED